MLWLALILTVLSVICFALAAFGFHVSEKIGFHEDRSERAWDKVGLWLAAGFIFAITASLAWKEHSEVARKIIEVSW